jgi:predicted enzyme related to lactoylglutathione lyase
MKKKRPLLISSILGVAMTALLLASAGTRNLQAQTVPPLPSSGTRHIGKFVWFDLVSSDVERAAAFYSQVLGWQIERVWGIDDYVVVRANGRRIGGITPAENPAEVGWIGSLSVGDVDEAAAWVKEHGGRVLQDPADLPNRGRMAVLADPQGAVFAALRSRNGDSSDRNSLPGDFAWVELWTTDLEGAHDFYRRLVGYQYAAVRGGYHVFGRQDIPRAGVVEIKWKGVEPNWLPYVVVRHLANVLRGVEGAGGSILQGPRDDFGDGRVALIVDPTGGVVGLWQERSR